MFVFSNNPALQASLPSNIYGDMQTQMERSNWLSVGIDYRSLYGKVFESLYGMSEGTFFPNFTGSLEQDLSTDPVTTPLMHVTYRAPSTGSVIPNVRFQIDDANFDDIDHGSYIQTRFSTGIGIWDDHTVPFSTTNSQTYTRVVEKTD